MKLRNRLVLRLRRYAPQLVLSVVEGLSMSGLFPLVLSVAERSRRTRRTLTAHHCPAGKGYSLPRGAEKSKEAACIAPVVGLPIPRGWSSAPSVARGCKIVVRAVGLPICSRPSSAANVALHSRQSKKRKGEKAKEQKSSLVFHVQRLTFPPPNLQRVTLLNI
jgi:hypothetical protein